jgi:hypothetical protein
MSVSFFPQSQAAFSYKKHHTMESAEFQAKEVICFCMIA